MTEVLQSTTANGKAESASNRIDSFFGEDIDDLDVLDSPDTGFPAEPGPSGSTFATAQAASTAATAGGTSENNIAPKALIRERDEIFWTELEIRRLSNLVAECIHARRYVGDNAAAMEERKEMRVYIEAMKRKAMRVLHRAEVFAQSGSSEWPGLDPTITDAVSLADEYVKVVEGYMGVLVNEEERAKKAEEERLANGDDAEGIPTIAQEDWEAADDVAYREAVKREVEKQVKENEQREKLLDVDSDGLRRRRGEARPSEESRASYSKEDEEFMAKHQPIQDELTSNLVEAVGQLKGSAIANQERLDRDKEVLDDTEDAVDKNLAGVGQQRANLDKHTRSTSLSWWLMMGGMAVVILVFIFVLFLISVPF